MADENGKLHTLNEKTLQNIQERLSKLERILEPLPNFIDSANNAIGTMAETLARIESNQNAHKSDIVLHRRRLNVQDERIAALENNRED